MKTSRLKVNTLQSNFFTRKTNYFVRSIFFLNPLAPSTDHRSCTRTHSHTQCQLICKILPRICISAHLKWRWLASIHFPFILRWLKGIEIGFDEKEYAFKQVAFVHHNASASFCLDEIILRNVYLFESKFLVSLVGYSARQQGIVFGQ